MTNEEAMSLLPGDKVLTATEFYKDPANSLRQWLGEVVTVKRVSREHECGEEIVFVEIKECNYGFYAQELSLLSPADFGNISDEVPDIKLLFGGDD